MEYSLLYVAINCATGKIILVRYVFILFTTTDQQFFIDLGFDETDFEYIKLMSSWVRNISFSYKIKGVCGPFKTEQSTFGLDPETK